MVDWMIYSWCEQCGYWGFQWWKWWQHFRGENLLAISISFSCTLLTIWNCSPAVYFSLKWFDKIETLKYDTCPSYAQANQSRRKRSREGTPTTGMTLFFTKCHILMNNRVVLGSQLFFCHHHSTHGVQSVYWVVSW